MIYRRQAAAASCSRPRSRAAVAAALVARVLAARVLAAW